MPADWDDDGDGDGDGGFKDLAKARPQPTVSGNQVFEPVHVHIKVILFGILLFSPTF